MQFQPQSPEEVPVELPATSTPRYPRERLVETGITAHGQVVLQINAARRELNLAQVTLAAQQAAMLVIGATTGVTGITERDDVRETQLAVIQGCIETLTAYIARYLKGPGQDTPLLLVTDHPSRERRGGQ